MPRRIVLTARQRSLLFDLPTDEASLPKHYTLADDDIDHIRKRRKARNRLGFALQLCAFRYPGRYLTADDAIPAKMVKFIAAQLGMRIDDLDGYAIREETRREHLLELRAIYGYKSFVGRGAQDLRDWLHGQAEDARSNEDLAHRLVERCRQMQTILPAITTIERLCADALVAAERRIELRIVERLDSTIRSRLDALLTETVEDYVSRFVWMRKFEIGNNSADANNLLDRLDFLQKLALDPHVLAGTPPHRITRLRRQGERYFTEGLSDVGADRRLAILAVCVVEWRATIADTLVETHDRIVGKTWREAKRLCDVRTADAKASVTDTLRAFSSLGTAVLKTHNDGGSLENAITLSPGWAELEKLVATASQLTDTMTADPISHVAQGYNRFRRYAPRMLRCLDIHATPVAEPLTAALALIKSGDDCLSLPTDFLRPTSNWSRLLKKVPNDCHLWEVAVLFHLRDAFRSADIWLGSSRRYADLRETLVPMPAVKDTSRLAIPFEPEAWLAARKLRMAEGLKRLAKAVRTGTIPKGSIEDGTLRIERLAAAVPSDAEGLILDLYQRMPEVRITHILLEVDAAIGFVDAFTHLRTGAPCNDRIGLLNVLLAEGLNLGLRKMAEASNTHDYWQLSRLSRWHVESDAINHALAMVVAAQGRLPMSQFWGAGETASSDGQFFPAARQGEAMNLINAKYGSEPGLKAYTHLSDQYAPFATQLIPATVSEAPYILDGLLMNETGQRIREQYADTGGFTDHVFAAASILGYQFIPHIRDLPSKRLYVFDPGSTPQELRGLIGGKIRDETIVQNWPDILRSAATMVAGIIPPSQLLRKFASYPRQHDLALALREIGRVERTLFLINWVIDIDMQRRARIGLNKGEAHHALKNALRIGRQGEIRDRTTEGQHYRMAGLNLLAAIVIYWNSVHLGHAVTKRQQAGLDVPPELLAHISPLGWAHILLTGEYRWPKL